MRRYEGRGLVGEKYLLQNISPTLMVLAEQEFDREGAQVMGVAIENHNLQPGETTNVFVIRQEAMR
jgi:conjugal transfer pilus assembly protein TraK